MNIRTVWTLVAMLLAGHVSPCRAALVENLTMGNAKALALGNAVTADPPGVDAIHFNPAGLGSGIVIRIPVKTSLSTR